MQTAPEIWNWKLKSRDPGMWYFPGNESGIGVMGNGEFEIGDHWGLGSSSADRWWVSGLSTHRRGQIISPPMRHLIIPIWRGRHLSIVWYFSTSISIFSLNSIYMFLCCYDHGFGFGSGSGSGSLQPFFLSYLYVLM